MESDFFASLVNNEVIVECDLLVSRPHKSLGGVRDQRECWGSVKGGDVA